MSGLPEETRPAYFLLSLLPAETEPVPDGSAGLWGELDLVAEVVQDLHAGSGVPELEGGELVAGVASRPAPRSGDPRAVERIVPGTAMKGAVRTVVEAITPSCDPLDRSGCTPVRACPACLTFGRQRLRGRVSLSDLVAEPDPPWAVVEIPQRYSHPGAPKRGRRLYGMEPERPEARESERLLALTAGCRLRGTLSLLGAPAWAAGLATLAVGLPPRGLPLLRVGGGKNKGMGAIRIELRGGWFSRDIASAVGAGGRREATSAVGRWQEEALDRFHQAPQRLAEVTRHYGGHQGGGGE